MRVILGHGTAPVRIYLTGVNEMNCGLNHAPGAGSIALPIDLQSNALILRGKFCTFANR